MSEVGKKKLVNLPNPSHIKLGDIPASEEAMTKLWSRIYLWSYECS
jgi:hypothetical protein